MTTKLSARQQSTRNEAGRIMFPCEYNGMMRTLTFTAWSLLTGENRDTIKTRFYQDRTARECIGLDKVPVKTRRQIHVQQVRRHDTKMISNLLSAKW